MPAAIAILLGLALGFACGGDLRALSQARLRYPYLLFVVFMLQGLLRGRIGAEGSDTWGLLFWATTSLVLIALLVLQPRNAMIAVVGVGIASNLLVVLLNGYMPVIPSSSTAGAAAVVSAPDFYAMATRGTIAPLLGDCLPLPLLGSTYLLSLGDLLLLSGAAAFVVGGMLAVSTGESPATSERLF